MLTLTQEQEDSLRRRDLSELTNIINSGIDVNLLVIPNNSDVLLVAITKEHKPFLNLVLSNGFNVKNNGFSYLHHAIRTHDLFFVDTIAEAYIKAGWSLDEHKFGENCLHVAAAENELPIDIFKYIESLGVSWSEKNNEGQTPLHVLVRKFKVITDEILDILKKEKKNLFALDDYNLSVIDILNSAKLSNEWCNKNQNVLLFIDEVNSDGR